MTDSPSGAYPSQGKVPLSRHLPSQTGWIETLACPATGEEQDRASRVTQYSSQTALFSETARAPEGAQQQVWAKQLF